MVKLFKRNHNGLLSQQALILSPDGRSFFHKGRWVGIPRGGAVDMIKGNSYFCEQFLFPFSSATNGLIAGHTIYTVASGATFARLAINGGAGRMTLAGDDADAVAVFGPRAYEPDECGLGWMQARIRSSSVVAGSIFVGMTDADDDNVIIEDEDGTIQTVPTDAFGVLLEGEQDGTWQTMGVGNDVDDTQYASTNIADLAAAAWTTIHIEYDRNGNAAQTVVRYRVRVNGVILRTSNTDGAGWTASVARSSVIYCPVVSADDRAAAYTVDVAEFAAQGGVGASLD